MLNNLIWADSTLEKIEIVYDNIKLLIHNDVLKKSIVLDCVECVGMSRICTWDEIIIESLSVEKIYVNQSKWLSEIAEIHNYCECTKQLSELLNELKIVFINGLSFSIFCRDIILDTK